MSKKNIITVLGGLVIALPFLGLPNTISTALYVVIGFSIIFISRVSPKKK